MANTYIAQTTDGTILFATTSVQRAVDSVVAYLNADAMGVVTGEYITAGCTMSFDGGETWEESEDPVSMVKPAMRGKSGSSVLMCLDPALSVVRLTFLLTI